MDGEGQFDNAKAGAEVSTRDGYGLDDLAAKLFGERFHVALRKRA
jgi:hypothetical protein